MVAAVPVVAPMPVVTPVPTLSSSSSSFFTTYLTPRPICNREQGLGSSLSVEVVAELLLSEPVSSFFVEAAPRLLLLLLLRARSRFCPCLWSCLLLGYFPASMPYGERGWNMPMKTGRRWIVRVRAARRAATARQNPCRTRLCHAVRHVHAGIQTGGKGECS
jgi:hypothetical protein